MRVETASVIGIPSKNSWSTTATLRVDGQEIFLAAGFSGGEQAPHEGRKFIRLLEGLHAPTAESIYQAVENFLKEMDRTTVASLAVLLKQGSKTILLAFGYSLAGLIRGGRGRWLADGKQDRVVLEGELHEGDSLLLATARASELAIQLNTLQDVDPEAVVGRFFSTVQSHTHSGELALLALEVGSTGGKVEMSHDLSGMKPVIGDSPSAHLISPEKLAQGVLASQGEQKSRIRASVSQRDIVGKLQQAFRNKKMLVRAGLAIGVFIVLILAMVVYRGASVAREYDTVVVPLEQKTQEVFALPPERIGEQRSEVQSLIERVKATRVSYGSNKRKLQELLIQLEEKNQVISGEKALVNLPVFYDFRLVNANFLGSKASREKNRAVFLDSGNSSLIVLNLDTKQNETFPREGLDLPSDVTLANSVAYALQFGKIMKSSVTASQAEVQVELPDVSEPLLLDRFGEALYVFDRSGQQIWRIGTEPEATPSGWVRSARGIDFSTITSMTINGSVWLGSNDGNIFKLTRGERDSFSVSGLIDPFTSTLLLATTEDGERLIVVEPAKKRLVVLNKSGEYQLQVESEQIGAVTDVFLSEDERGVYLVAGSVVYRVDI